MAEPGFIGDPRLKHPIPLRYRSPFIEREEGGSKGYRGPGYQEARKRALWRAGYRSTATGLTSKDVTLFVDHIIGYRLGMTHLTNDQVNLRVLDADNNKYMDHMEGFAERKVKRLRAW